MSIPVFSLLLLIFLYSKQNTNLVNKSNVVNYQPNTPDTLGQLDIGDTTPPSGLDLSVVTDDSQYYDYVLSSGSSVSYRITKLFIGQPAQEVVGTGTGVIGNGSLSKDGKHIKVNAQIDLTSIKTDSPKRDSDVLKLFKSTLAELTADVDLSNPVTLGDSTTSDVPANFTLNGVTKEITLSVAGQATDKNFTAKGTSKVKLTDFGINPPSLADVFTVSDDITFEFTINGNRTN